MCMTDPKHESAGQLFEDGRCKAGLPQALFTAMNALNLGILIVDGECRIIFANAYATKLLQSLRGPPVKTTRRADRIGDASPFDSRFREAISTGKCRTDGFLALNGAGVNSMIVQTVPYRDEDTGQAGASGSILFVSDVTTKPELDLTPTAKLYGLTRAELRLLEALLSGEKLNDYARRERVTQNTVKGHLAQLFRKTQTCRQSELVLRVLANPVFRLASRHSAIHPPDRGSIS